MRSCARIVGVLVALASLLTVPALHSQTTVFTYQGRLCIGGEPVSGVYDLVFSIYDSSVGGSRAAGPVTNANVPVSVGLFSLPIDLGASVFTGADRWLEIGVRANGGPTFSTLSPRQMLSATPYAIRARNVNADGITGTLAASNIGDATIASRMLAPGAAAGNLAASGATVLSTDSNATNLIGAGYARFGGPLDLSWQQITSTLAPTPRGSHTAVWTGNAMIIWGGDGANLSPLNSGAVYSPASGSWAATTLSNAPSPRDGHIAVWVGTEMMVWGGFGSGYLGDGSRYNPTSDTWRPVTRSNAPAARRYPSAVWTGREIIIWGGNGDGDVNLNTGARYDPVSDSWRAVSTSNAPTARIQHTAVWTGSEMIVWGGLLGANTQVNDGARYNPLTDSWSPMTTNGAPAARHAHSAVWTGNEMVVWGGRKGQLNASTFSSDGARYNSATDTWSSLPNQGSPAARAAHSAVWTGSEMIVWGGIGDASWLNSGGRYNPVKDVWSALTTSGAPAPREGQTAVWTGSEMLVFGGYVENTTFGDAFSYSPSRLLYMYLHP